MKNSKYKELTVKNAYISARNFMKQKKKKLKETLILVLINNENLKLAKS